MRKLLLILLVVAVIFMPAIGFAKDGWSISVGNGGYGYGGGYYGGGYYGTNYYRPVYRPPGGIYSQYACGYPPCGGAVYVITPPPAYGGGVYYNGGGYGYGVPPYSSMPYQAGGFHQDFFDYMGRFFGALGMFPGNFTYWSR